MSATAGDKEPGQGAGLGTGQAMLSLTVMSGPDEGQTGRFDQARVRIGRDVDNDFILRDRYVSNQHGEFRRVTGGFLYQDLQSRHGSIVLVDDVSVRLHGGESTRPVRLTREGEIQVGSSVLRVLIERSAEPQSKGFARSTDFVEPAAAGDDRYIMATQTSLEALTRRFSNKDKRLEIIFRLAGKLNSQNRLEEVIDLIADATFEVFPAASLFSINVLDGGALAPFTTRVRAGAEVGREVILSQSILERVAKTQEAVLFARDNLGGDISRSIIEAQISASLCAPLVGQRSLLGVMQVDSRSMGLAFTQDDLELFSVFASNVAFALERARLTEDIYRMFEGFVNASVSAIEARDPTTAGHSARVASYSLALALKANLAQAGPFADFQLTPTELTELRYAALLHDFGKVGVRESVLVKGQRITDAGMELIAQRFATFRHLEWRRLAARVLEQASGGGAVELGDLSSRHDAFCLELDAIFARLDEIRSLNALRDDDIAFVQRLMARSIEDVNGQRLSFLTPSEAEHLTIRFGTLSPAEWENMRAHAAMSEAYLERIPWSEDLRRVPCIAGAHHEKLDGSGYPRGIAAELILPQVRILTIADIFDAVTAWDRPYRKAATVEQAVNILQSEARGGKLDRSMVELFVDEVLPDIVRLIPAG